MATTTTTRAVRPSLNQGLPALGLALLIIAAEYLARHFLLFWFPTLGTLRVNDMLATALIYTALVWFTLAPEQRNMGAISAALRSILSEARRWQPWVAALVTIGASLVVLLDLWLWGAVTLPSVISPWRWEAVLFAPWAWLLGPLSLLLVNGLLIPFAEEWLWRGKIQPQLIGASGAILGLVITSVLFSLKHAIIDASPGRLLMLTIFGLIMGFIALRYSWRAAALTHALANLFATTMALIATPPAL